MESLSLPPEEMPGSVIPVGATALVYAALNNPEWNFRTPQGIERETGVPAPIAEAILEMSPEARRSVLKNRDGQNIYAPKDRRRTAREVLEEHRRYLTGEFLD